MAASRRPPSTRSTRSCSSEGRDTARLPGTLRGLCAKPRHGRHSSRSCRANSQWFKETLSRSDSGRAQKVELLFDNRIDYPPAVEQVFTYFYTHEIEITQNNFKSLLQVAYILGVERLIDHCVDYIKCVTATKTAVTLDRRPRLSRYRRVARSTAPVTPRGPARRPRLTTGNCLQALMSALEINHENFLLACFNFIAQFIA